MIHVDAPFDFLFLAIRQALDFFRLHADGSGEAIIHDPHSGRNRANAKFRLEWSANLAGDHHVQGSVQALGNLGGYDHSASGKAEHDWVFAGEPL